MHKHLDVLQRPPGAGCCVPHSPCSDCRCQAHLSLRHHTFRKNLRVLLAGVPWLREQRGVLDVTDAKCAARAQACLLARVPGFK